ncbi:unnamed protein product [Notodromas monacha]|uniref:UDP-glucuronosyltransferase n=1 Tax=Notodromas monacha TaxID=399045 RepID=A0A7R9C1S5_9CRUS|nr:unnamed protein product [Notodromas monacha]CAG0925848.1 unnamed protein product [Notodromas monacha]
MLLWGDITTQRLVSDITDVLTDPKYAKAAKKRSAIMKDREEEPAAKGAFWIEYAIRNHGAPHLRSAGRFLPWYQYYMLDVYVVIFVAFYLLFFIFKTSIVLMIKICGKIVPLLKEKKE